MTGTLKPEAEHRNELSAWLQFLELESHVLSEYPDLLFQQAANSYIGSVPGMAAYRRDASSLEKRPWLRRLNRSSQATPNKITLSGHSGTPISCSFSPDGSLIASGSATPDGSLRIWDATNGRQLISHRLGKSVSSCHFLPQGRQVLWASGSSDPGEPECGILDIDSGACLMRFVPKGATLIPGLMAVSPNGRRVAVRVAPQPATGCAGDHRHLKGLELRVFDTASGRETASLAGHASEIKMCAFSPDGAFLASGTDAELRLWDTRRGREIAAAGEFPLFGDLDHPGHLWDAYPKALVFSNSGKILVAVCGDSTLKRGEGRTLRPIDVVPLEIDLPNEAFAALLLSVRLDRIIAVTGDEVIVFDARTGRLIGRLEPRSYSWRITCAALSPDETRIVAACGDNNLRVFDCSEARMTTERSRLTVLASLAFSPDGRLLLGSGRKGIAVWDAVRGRELMEIDKVKLLGDDLKEIATPSPAADGLDQDIIWRLWQRGAFREAHLPETRRALRHVEEQLRPEYYGAMDISIKGGDILVWRNDMSVPPVICHWEAQPDECLLDYMEFGKVSRDRNRFFVQTAGRTTRSSWLRAYDLSTGKLLFLLEARSGFRKWVLSPDDTLAASFGESGTIFWDLALGTQIISPVITEETRLVSFRKGRCAALGLQNGTIEIWDLASKMKIRTFVGHASPIDSFHFSPDGKRLVSTSRDDKAIFLWDTEDGREVARICGRLDWNAHFGGFSRTGHMLMTGQGNGWLRLWDAETGELIAQDPGSGGGDWGPVGPILAAVGEANEPILLRLENWAKIGISELPESWDPDRDGLPFPPESRPTEPDPLSTSGKARLQYSNGASSHWTRLNRSGSSWMSKLFKKNRKRDKREDP